MRYAILSTLAYADIFDYPLTLPQINRWLISKTPQTISTIKPSSRFQSRDNYCFLKDRSHLVSLRQKRQHFSRQKLKLARRVGEWLKIIPTIKMVAITGALAMNNSDKHDDIDLMIVTSPNTLWLTRLVVTLFLEIIGIRRQPLPRKSASVNPRSSASINNKICLNLWLDETSLTIPKSQRNLYTAHEVAQVKPLWSKNNVYQKFLAANPWINDFLPNIKIKGYYPHQAHKRVIPFINLIEKLAYHFQLWYMKPKITRERVSPHFAFFHPNNMRKYVMAEYHKRLKQLSINS